MKIRVLLDKEKISQIVNKLAKRINGRELNAVVVLKGARRFYTDLRKKVKCKVNTYFIELASYSKEKSSGKIKVVKDIDRDISGKDILIIEDIVDTGLTISFLKKYLLKKGVKSVKVCTLLSKPSRRKVKIKLDYVGSRVPDKFVVGYGLDFEQKYRDLGYIGVLEKDY